MALVTWKDEYAVKVEEIDEQHKRLVALINELHDAIKTGTSKNILGNILSELVNYTVYHFGTEEKYFDLYKYPESEEHKKQHADLVTKVAEVQKKMEAGEKVLSIEVMNFLRDWLQDHIIGSDKKFGPFLNSNGLR